MAGTWREVVRLQFTGERFRDHALDLTAVTELRQFQRIVAETAKALWRAAHPERERLPARFEDRTRLCLRRIEEGSAVAPLEIYVQDSPQSDLWESEIQEVREAIALARDVFESVARDAPLPARLPRELLSEYMEWGKTLGPDEAIDVEPTEAQGRSARVNGETRAKLERFAEASHPATVELTGHVLEADVRQRRFQLWIDDKVAVGAPFTEEEEGFVTSALKEHRSTRVTVRGQADMSPQGKPIRFTRVDRVSTQSDEVLPDAGARPIEEVLAEIATHVTVQQWAKLPPDLTDQLDHYLYGTPKR